MKDGLAAAASRGVSITLAAQAAKIALTFANVVILARLLEPGEFGLVGLILSLIGIAEVLRDFGLSTAAIQAKSLSSAQRTNLFWANTLLGSLLTLIVALAAPLIAGLYDKPEMIAPTVALAFTFMLNGAAAQYSASLARDLRFDALAFVGVAAQLVALGIAAAMAYSGFGLWALVAQQLAISAGMFILSAAMGGWLPGLPQRNVTLRPFVKFGAATLGTQSVGYAARNVDMIALGFVASAPVLGYYNRATQLVSVPLNQINAPLTRVALPILSKVSSDIPRLQRYLDKSQLVACYLTATALLVAAGLAGPLVEVLLGPKWAPVTPLFIILAIGGVFRAMSQVTYWSYLAQGLVGAQLRLHAGLRPALSLLILAGLPWGAVGVATAYAVVQLLFWLAGLWHIQRVSPIRTGPLLRRSLLAIALLAAPAGLLAHLVAQFLNSPWLQIAGGGTAAVIYALSITWAFPAFRRDFLMIRSFIAGMGASK